MLKEKGSINKVIGSILLCGFIFLMQAFLAAPAYALESAKIPNGDYVIKSQLGKNVEIGGGSKANGATANIGDTWQIFNLERQSDGTYKITPKFSGKPLEVRDSSKNNGAGVAQWDWNASYACKRWYIIDCGSGWYKLVNKESGKCLDVKGGSSSSGTVLQQYTDNGSNAQRFSFTTLESAKIANGDYIIKSKLGKNVEIGGGNSTNGATANIWDAADVTHQTFNLERQSDGTYKITPKHSRKPLEVRDSSHSNGAAVAQWDWDASYACKRWYIIDCGSGWYKLINKESGKCLDVKSGSSNNGTMLQQYVDNGSNAQRFSFTAKTSSSSPSSSTKGILSANFKANKTYEVQKTSACKATALATALNILTNSSNYTQTKLGGSNGYPCSNIDGKVYTGSDGNKYTAEYHTDSDTSVTASKQKDMIAKAMANDLPIVVAVHSTKKGVTNHHWVTVVGLNGGDYKIIDPWDGKVSTMSGKSYALGLTSGSKPAYGYISFTKQ